MTRWFWAWRRLKNREDLDETPPVGADEALVNVLIQSLIRTNKIHGDGKFDRVVNYIRTIRETVEFVRANWVGHDPVLTAYFMGIDSVISELERTLDEIKKTP